MLSHPRLRAPARSGSSTTAPLQSTRTVTPARAVHGALGRGDQLMLRIKRVYEPATPGDGARVLVDRLWPRGLNKEEAHLDDWLQRRASRVVRARPAALRRVPEALRARARGRRCADAPRRSGSPCHARHADARLRGEGRGAQQRGRAGAGDRATRSTDRSCRVATQSERAEGKGDHLREAPGTIPRRSAGWPARIDRRTTRAHAGVTEQSESTASVSLPMDAATQPACPDRAVGCRCDEFTL